MGFNFHDRVFEGDVRQRAREVRRLDAQGRALRLIVTGADAFNDRCFVVEVMNRLHAERGVAAICYSAINRATRYADAWAQSRHARVEWVAPSRLLQRRAHGVVAFDGPQDFVDRARRAGFTVWMVRPRFQPPSESRAASERLTRASR